MRRVKLGLYILVAILLAIQFIQPARNQGMQASNMGIEKVMVVPDEVQAILKNSCYDCHSNNTRYPWYAKIQPGAWWMASHINEGKAELNFDEFGNYSRRRQNSKLKSIVSSIEDETMPIPSYLLIHSKAALSKADQVLIKQWSEKTMKQNL